MLMLMGQVWENSLAVWTQTLFSYIFKVEITSDQVRDMHVYTGEAQGRASTQWTVCDENEIPAP